MKKIISFVWFCSLAISFASCDQKEEETASILPNVEATMERTFDYLGSEETDRMVYTLSLSEMQLLSDDDRLEVMFAPTKPVRKDAIVFNIRKTDLKNGYVGTYSLKSLSTNKSGKAELTYYHYHNKTSSNALFSVGNQMEGNFEIKTYNASTGLASGSYVVNIKNVTDPTAYETNPSTPRKCDIILRGEFNNLKLKK
ncbi:hypothetical protein [uncultured Pontibacter sp.]|uniref:hypothetical protein n=1 Tax=uncultured Pontibacter sp. TaxID=453356 RepID=UPI00262E78C0|nr:hypothetical protein [uncultured Pontibacter sp.]